MSNTAQGQGHCLELKPFVKLDGLVCSYFDYNGDGDMVYTGCVSPLPSLQQALCLGNLGMAKYLLINMAFTLEDLHRDDTKKAISFLGDAEREEFEQLSREPMPLVNLSLLAVSKGVGFNPTTRRKRTQATGLPNRIQEILLCKTDRARVCVSQWKNIHLSVGTDEYDQRSRPLLYNWPLTGGLHSCACFFCQGQDLKVNS